METKVPCILCGAAILPATAARTEGKCMPCFKDPLGSRAADRAAERLGASTSTVDLLRMTEETTIRAALRVARTAATDLASERIYGCCLFHTQFLSLSGITVFTEAGLDQAANEALARGSSTSRADLRWNPCDSPHHLYLWDEFDAAEQLFSALHHKGSTREIAVEVERMGLRTLRALRDAALFEPHVVLTLAEGDQCFEDRYAYAERFCSPLALETFRREVPELDECLLDFSRSRIPTF